MKRSRVIKSGLRTMGRHKMRSSFMMLGVVVGITALMLVVAMGKSTQAEIMAKVERMFSPSNIMLFSGPGQMRGFQEGGPTTTLVLEDLEAIEAEIPNVELADPLQMLLNQDAIYKDKSTELNVMGHSPAAEVVWNRSVTRGSYFTEADMRQSARVALIGETAVRDLFGDIDPIGEQIRVGSVPFRIIGILEPMGIDPHGIDKDNEIIVPITTVMRRLMNVDYVMAASLRVRDRDKIDDTVADITALLRERHHINADETDDFSMMTSVQIREMVESMTRIFTVFLPLIAAISILVGGVVLANLMLISVNERTSEIGLRKAVGARSNDILTQFLIESTTVTLVGGIVGVALGLAGIQAMAAMMGLPPTIPWGAMTIGLAFSALVGLAAGVFPARRAATLQPVEALR